MTAINSLKRIRGTTKPFRLVLKTSGVGFSFRMVVDRRVDPDDDSTEAMDMTGVLDPLDDLAVDFTPSGPESLAGPGLFHFQIQRTRDSDNSVDYPADGVLELVQSIPK